jgi:hypothetical protein
MLSDKETSFTAAAFVDNHPVAALTGRSEGLGFFGEWSPFTDSFFYIAMGISEPRVRARPHDRIR